MMASYSAGRPEGVQEITQDQKCINMTTANAENQN